MVLMVSKGANNVLLHPAASDDANDDLRPSIVALDCLSGKVDEDDETINGTFECLLDAPPRISKFSEDRSLIWRGYNCKL